MTAVAITMTDPNRLGVFDFCHAAMVPKHERFDRELAAAAREMQDEDSSRQAMDRAVTIATQILPGCDAAGVCFVYRERVDTHATSHDALRQVDSLQHQLKEGPCLDALRQKDTVQRNCQDLWIGVSCDLLIAS